MGYVSLPEGKGFIGIVDLLSWIVGLVGHFVLQPLSSGHLPSGKLTFSPLKIGLPKRKSIFQPSIFRCCVSFREGCRIFG